MSCVRKVSRRSLIAVFVFLFSSAAFAQSQPNLLFLFADDLGYGDLACYGAPDAETPNLDRLARQGVRFTQHYSNGPECTPTRTGLTTGRDPQRVGGLECAIGTGNVGRYDDAIRLAATHDLGLPPKSTALASRIKEAGYDTAIFGKWHLGYEAKFNPLACGFDEFLGCLGGYVDYFTHRELSPLHVLYKDRKPFVRDGYMSHLIADAANEFIKRDRERPFFLYVPFTSPHFPFQGPDDADVETTADNLTKGTREKYVELVEDLDTQIGRILKTLDDAGLSDNTLVVFASDNGAMKPGRNLPFSGFKCTLYEGGIRVPRIVRWPGQIKPGSQSDQVCVTMDLTKSLLHVAGTDTTNVPLDGMDIVRQVQDQRPEVPRTLFWRARRGERTERAVRDSDLKYLHRQLDDGTLEERLFDFKEDRQ